MANGSGQLEEYRRVKDPVTTFLDAEETALNAVANIEEMYAQFQAMHPLIASDPDIPLEYKLNAKNRYNAFVLSVQAKAAAMQTI